MMPPFLAWSELRRTSLSILPRRRTHFLLSLGDEQLAQLAQPQDGAGNRDAHEPVSEAQTHGTECGLQERCVDDQDLQRKRHHKRTPQPRTGQYRQEHLFLLTEVGGGPLLPELEEGLCGLFRRVGFVARGCPPEPAGLHQPAMVMVRQLPELWGALHTLYLPPLFCLELRFFHSLLTMTRTFFDVQVSDPIESEQGQPEQAGLSD